MVLIAQSDPSLSVIVFLEIWVFAKVIDDHGEDQSVQIIRIADALFKQRSQRIERLGLQADVLRLTTDEAVVIIVDNPPQGQDSDQGAIDLVVVLAIEDLGR